MNSEQQPHPVNGYESPVLGFEFGYADLFNRCRVLLE